MVRLLNGRKGGAVKHRSPPAFKPAELWAIPRDWIGDTVFIIAGGPSVKDQDLSRLAGKRVIVINSSWEVFPNADLLFFADVRWWNANNPKVLKGFRGPVATISYGAKNKRLLKLQKVKPPPGLTKEPSKVVCRFTSLQAAINIAVHRGVAKIVLLGADMGRGPNGETHHHADHKWPQRDGCWDQQMSDLIHTVPLLREWGIDVINTSLRSRIDWWPKISLEEFLG